MSDETDRKNDEIEWLQNEVARLQRYEKIVETQSAGLGAAGALFAFIWAGPGLSLAFRNFLSAKAGEGEVIPIEATADLLAAVVRRVIRVGLLIALFAMVPTGLLLWQNLIMRDQYAALIRQIEAQRATDINQQITQHMPLLLSEDTASFWAAASFFSSAPELSEEARDRLVRLLV